jgi:hypothetical protein
VLIITRSRFNILGSQTSPARIGHHHQDTHEKSSSFAFSYFKGHNSQPDTIVLHPRSHWICIYSQALLATSTCLVQLQRGLIYRLENLWPLSHYRNYKTEKTFGGVCLVLLMYASSGRCSLSTCAVPSFPPLTLSCPSPTASTTLRLSSSPMPSIIPRSSSFLKIFLSVLSHSEHRRLWLLAVLHLSRHTKKLIYGTAIEATARLAALENLHVESCLSFPMVASSTIVKPSGTCSITQRVSSESLSLASCRSPKASQYSITAVSVPGISLSRAVCHCFPVRTTVTLRCGHFHELVISRSLRTLAIKDVTLSCDRAMSSV